MERIDELKDLIKVDALSSLEEWNYSQDSEDVELLLSIKDEWITEIKEQLMGKVGKIQYDLERLKNKYANIHEIAADCGWAIDCSFDIVSEVKSRVTEKMQILQTTTSLTWLYECHKYFELVEDGIYEREQKLRTIKEKL